MHSLKKHSTVVADISLKEARTAFSHKLVKATSVLTSCNLLDMQNLDCVSTRERWCCTIHKDLCEERGCILMLQAFIEISSLKSTRRLPSKPFKFQLAASIGSDDAV